MPTQRHFPNWLQAFRNLFLDTEVPLTYSSWAGIWAVSGALRNNVFVQRWSTEMDPHLYIFLVGPSGSGKSFAAHTATEMLKTIDCTPLYQGAQTPSRFMHYIHNMAQQQAFQRPNAHVSFTLFSDELANTIGMNNQAVEFLRIMTQLWNGRFEYDTHAHSLLIADHPAINWLALSTVSWLRESMPRNLISSGFVARVITSRSDLSPEPITPGSATFDHDAYLKLCVDLIQISRLNGTYFLSPGAEDARNEWYKAAGMTRREMKDPITIEMYGREDEHVLKLAMCLMASIGDSFEITRTAMINAIRIVESAKQSSVDMYRSLAVGDSDVEVTQYIEERMRSIDKPMTRTEIVRMTRGVAGSSATITAALQQLKEAEIIEVYKQYGLKAPLYRIKKELPGATDDDSNDSTSRSPVP